MDYCYELPNVWNGATYRDEIWNGAALFQDEMSLHEMVQASALKCWSH
jgi:hypothetical protein